MTRPVSPEALDQLDWMIGTWTDGDENTTVRTVCEWAKNHTFITRSFKAFVDGKIDLEGTQVIGWDPAAGRIRSWVFDSDGGFMTADRFIRGGDVAELRRIVQAACQ